MNMSGAAVVLLVGVSTSAACHGAAQAETPQMPTARPPYRIGAMTITSGAVSLAGTVTIPEGPGPFPAVIIARGAGSAELDATLADGLTRRGIVVLRADGRGVGLSTGVASAPQDALADDIVAMISSVKDIPTVDRARVGVVGHGPGSALAALAATRSSSVTFVGALSAERSAETLLSKVTVPLYRADGDPARTDVVATIAAWILSLR